MSYRESLAAALDAVEGARTFNLTDGRKGQAIVAAARERLAQMPETCGTCDGLGRTGTKSVGIETEVWASGPCPTCHGSGKVYPAELVERIEKALDAYFQAENNDSPAVAVLESLNEGGARVKISPELNGGSLSNRSSRPQF